MAGDAFEVHPEALRRAGQQLGEKAGEAGELVVAAQAADVGTTSWGELGLGLGLHAHYAQVRDSADRSLGKVREFLAWSQTAMNETAQAYESADAEAGRSFRSIGEDLDS